MNTASLTTIRGHLHDEPRCAGKISFATTFDEAREHSSAGPRRSGQ